MRHISAYDRVDAAIKHLPEIITAMEHNDKARAQSHADIIRSHLREVQKSMDKVMTVALQELSAR